MQQLLVAEEFSEVVRSIAVNAPMGEDSDFVMNSEGDGEPLD